MTEPEKTRVGDRLTIYPRGAKGIYVADFWEANVHRKVSLRTANKKVAIERATKIAAELHQGTYRQPPEPIDVERACADYVSSLLTNDRAKKTIVKYEGIFRNFRAFLTKRRLTKLHQVTASLFDSWRAERRGSRHPKTVYTESVVVMQMMKWAASRKLIAENPLAGMRLNKPASEPKPAPTLKQVNAILAAAEEPLRTWLTVLSFTGMRVGELRRIRKEDLDLPGNWIHVRSRAGAETKTRLSRSIPIHPRLKEVLSRLPASAHPWLFTAGPSTKYPTGGNCINSKRVNDQFARLLRRLELPQGRESGFVVHSLRHHFETCTHNSGIPQRVIDAWMGHRGDRSMGAVYYRLSEEDSQTFMMKVPFGDATPDGKGSASTDPESQPDTE